MCNVIKSSLANYVKTLKNITTESNIWITKTTAITRPVTLQVQIGHAWEADGHWKDYCELCSADMELRVSRYLN